MPFENSDTIRRVPTDAPVSECFDCGVDLYESMGCTWSIDFLLFVLGDRNSMRQSCSLCVMKKLQTLLLRSQY